MVTSKRRIALFFWVLFVATTARLATAAESRATTDQASEEPRPITVELLTMGPGQHPFFKFGHNAIRIRDARDETDWVYNFGTFSFTSNTLIGDFFKGRLSYWLSVDSYENTIEHYAGERRQLLAQRLALPIEATVALKAMLERNALPAHRVYKYDYFFDNCSTRVRDALDLATSHAVQSALQKPAHQSLRAHALRATADYVLEYLVLSIGLGPRVDRGVDQWTETFLPEVLSAALRQVRLRQRDGTEIALVQSERLVLPFPAPRLAHPPAWRLNFLLLGLSAAALWLVFGHLSSRKRAARWAFGTLLIVGGLLAGLVGFGLLALWFLTDHAVAYRNQNLLLLSPLALVLSWYGVRLFGTRAHRPALMRSLNKWAAALALSACLALGVKVLPFEHQDNGDLIAFFLPCWLGLYLATTLGAPAASRSRL